MANRPIPGMANSNPYSYLNQIKDPGVRQAIKIALDQLGLLQTQMQGIGSLTRPLTQNLDASAKRLTRVLDPQDPQDAVTKAFLENYVAGFASSFSGAQAAAGGGTNPDGEEAPPGPDDDIPDHGDVVTAIWNSAPLGPASSELDKYRFVQAVASALETVDAPLTCGLLEKDSGANIYSCGGISYSISRICYDNGHIFKVLIDADPGGLNTPTWADNGAVDLALYKPVASSGSC